MAVPTHSRPTMPPTGRRHVFRHWILEIFLLLLSTALLGGIATILFLHDGNYLTDWRFPINLNTSIAFLGTVYRACIALILAEIIGQCKWSWFRNRPRALQDLQVYDEASRGAMGCLKLWTKYFDGNVLALVSALALTLSFAIGSFVQQSVDSVECPRQTKDSEAYVMSSTSMPAIPYAQLTGIELASEEIAAAINGLINPNTHDTYGVSNCPSNNCAFPRTADIPHSTIGVCSRCMDTTPFVETSALGTWTSPLNDTSFLDYVAQSSQPEMAIWGSSLESEDSRAIVDDMDEELREIARLGFVNVTILAAKPQACRDGLCHYEEAPKEGESSPTPAYASAMCMLYPCLQDFEAEIRNNSLQIDVVSTTPMPMNGRREEVFSGYPWLHKRDFIVKSPCVVEGKVYDWGNFSDAPGIVGNFRNTNATNTTQHILVEVPVNGTTSVVPSECFYNVDKSWREHFTNHLNATVFLDNNTIVTCVDHEGRGGKLKCDSDIWWLNDLWDWSEPVTFELFENVFDGLAITLTNYFRGVGEVGRTANPVRIEGVTDETTLCVHFNWPWLLFPGAMYLATLVVLMVTIIQNHMDRRQSVWKTNILPLLLFGLERIKPYEESGPLPEDLNQIGKIAKKMPVVLRVSATTGVSIFSEVPRTQVYRGGNSRASGLESDSETRVSSRAFSGQGPAYYAVAGDEGQYERRGGAGGHFSEDASVRTVDTNRRRILSKPRPGY